MRKRFLVVLGLGIVFVTRTLAQQPNIDQYVNMVESGQVDAVRTDLPGLLRQYPDNPGVLYLQALLTTDGAEAVRQYQKIVDTYPNSEWADDALYKVYKFYYAIGLYRTAELKLDQLRTNYPNSRYVAGRASTEISSEETTVRTEPEVTPAESPVRRVGEPPTGESKPVPPPRGVEPATVDRPYTLQVGAYSTMANANRQKSFFDYHNYAADVGTKMSGAKELFVVYVGRYATEEDARRTGDELKRSFNIDYIIVMR